MFNLWPNWLAYSFFAPLLIRLAVGVLTIYFGYLTYHAWARHGRVVGVLWILGGLFLILGLFTQVAALALIILLILKFLGLGSAVKWPWYFDLLLLAALFSLLLTGAGSMAIDLPL